VSPEIKASKLHLAPGNLRSMLWHTRADGVEAQAFELLETIAPVGCRDAKVVEGA
jgi:hypothetical protein